MFEEHIERYLLQNTHRLFYIARPDPNFASDWQARITGELASVKAAMTGDEQAELNREVLGLQEAAGKKKPVHLLPRMRRTDIDPCGKRYLPDYEADGVMVFRQAMAGLTDMRVEIRVPLDDERVSLLGLAAHLLTKLGAGEMDDEQFALYTEKYMDELSLSAYVRSDLDDPDKFAYTLQIPGYCRDDDFDHLLNAVKLIIGSPHTHNLPVLETLLRERFRSATQALSRSAILQVRLRLSAGVRPSAVLDEAEAGVSAIVQLRDIVRSQNWEGFANELDFVVQEIIRKGLMRVCLHVGSLQQQEKIIPKVAKFVREFNGDRELPAGVPARFFERWREFASHKSVFWDVDTKSNYCGWAVPVGAFSDPISPVLVALADLMQHEYLHQTVRVALGAYGAFAIYDCEEATLGLLSYRDTNAGGVLAAFQAAIKAAANGEGIDDEVVENLVLRCFGTLDKPPSPQARGLSYWGGKSVEIIQKRRDIYYGLTKEQLVNAAKLVQALEGSTVIYSSQKIAKAPEGFEVVPMLPD
jgi:Zn-dependent M16 (insulinase) family peptidase